MEEDGSAGERNRRISSAGVSREESEDEYLKTECHQVQVVGGQGVGKTELLDKLISPDDVTSHHPDQGDSAGCIVFVLLEGVECQLVFSETQQEEEVRDPNR